MFFMSRANRKQRQAVADMRAGIEVGVKVVTNGGVYGEVVDIDGEVITIETTPGTEIMTSRNFIAGITDPPFEVVAEGTEDLDLTVPDDASALTAGDEPADTTEAGPDASASSADEAGDSDKRA